MERVSQVKGHVLLLGDFNLPKFSSEDKIPTLKQDCKYLSLYSDFADMLADHNLIQIVTEPLRYEHVLDLFLTNNSTVVNKVELIPGFSDHDIVYTKVSIKPQILPQKPRVVSVYKKADWDALSCHMSTFQETFMVDHESKSVNKLWFDFKTAIQEGIDKFFPKKTIISKPSLPWMTQEIRRNIRKRDSLFQKYKKNSTPKDREVLSKLGTR